MMRNRGLWLASAVLATLALDGAGVAQPPGRRGGPPDRFGRRGGPGGLEQVVDDLKLSEKNKETASAAVRAYRENTRKLAELARAGLLLKMKETLSPDEFKKFKEATDRFRGGRGPAVDAIVERIMSFDKNKDGKVTKDELPERMQHLIARGDTNKDGALDRDEIRKLATELARDGSFPGRGFGGPFRGGPRGRGGPGRGFLPGGLEQAVEALKLSEKKKETATAAVKAYQENTRKLAELARADLLLKMSEVLSEAEFQKVKAAVDRPPGPGDRPGRRGGPPGRRPPFRPERP
jgi:hypothetical protein